MKIVLDIRQPLEKNAAEYFERAKKAKSKIDTVKKIISKYTRELVSLKSKESDAIEAYNLEQEKKNLPKPEKKWYHSFRWFRTSENFLVVGGRDASSNEIVIKKHTEKHDLVLHTDMQGSPFFVIKSEGKPISEPSIQETADATTTFSRAWKLNMPSAEVGIGKPEQFSKTAPSGEYAPHGGFIISGKLTKKTGKANLAVGIDENNEVMAGPIKAVETNCKNFLVLEQGKDKPSEVARLIKKSIGGDVDGIVRVLPAGLFKVKTKR